MTLPSDFGFESIPPPPEIANILVQLNEMPEFAPNFKQSEFPCGRAFEESDSDREMLICGIYVKIDDPTVGKVAYGCERLAQAGAIKLRKMGIECVVTPSPGGRHMWHVDFNPLTLKELPR